MASLKIPAELISYQKLALRTHKGIKIFNLEDISFLKGLGRYTSIYLDNGKNFTVSKVLKHFEQTLPSCFFRIHKSYLVNLYHIVELKNNQKDAVVLRNGIMLEVAKNQGVDVPK